MNVLVKFVPKQRLDSISKEIGVQASLISMFSVGDWRGWDNSQMQEGESDRNFLNESLEDFENSKWWWTISGGMIQLHPNKPILI